MASTTTSEDNYDSDIHLVVTKISDLVFFAHWDYTGTSFSAVHICFIFESPLFFRSWILPIIMFSQYYNNQYFKRRVT